ncbi:MAG: DUF885 family protein, partial [Aureliella sp.]
MQRLFAKIATLVLVAGLALPQTLSAQTADQRLEAFFKAHLEECFQMRPLEATLLGDHRFDHLLDDISAEARDRWLEHYQKQLERLNDQFGDAELSSDGKIDYEIFKADLVRNIWLAEN